MINNLKYAESKLIYHPAVSSQSRNALLKAKDEEWTVCELQPLVYVHIIEDQRFQQLSHRARAAVGCTERMNNVLSGNGIKYIGDLIELTSIQLLQKTRSKHSGGGMGIGLYGDLIWALGHFDRYEECVEPFTKAMMPRSFPEGYIPIAKPEWGYTID